MLITIVYALTMEQFATSDTVQQVALQFSKLVDPMALEMTADDMTATLDCIKENGSHCKLIPNEVSGMTARDSNSFTDRANAIAAQLADEEIEYITYMFTSSHGLKKRMQSHTTGRVIRSTGLSGVVVHGDCPQPIYISTTTINNVSRQRGCSTGGLGFLAMMAIGIIALSRPDWIPLSHGLALAFIIVPPAIIASFLLLVCSFMVCFGTAAVVAVIYTLIGISRE